MHNFHPLENLGFFKKREGGDSAAVDWTRYFVAIVVHCETDHHFSGGRGGEGGSGELKFYWAKNFFSSTSKQIEYIQHFFACLALKQLF